MASANSTHKWSVIITATQAEDYVYRSESQGPPVVGPAGEPIDAAKSRIIDTIEENKVAVKEMETETGTYFQIKHISIDCPPAVTTTYSVTFPADVNVISADTFFSAVHEGDSMEWLGAPNTVIGGLALDAALGATTFTVSQTVIDNIEPLFRVTLINAADPTDFEEVGVMTDFDEVAMTVTVTAPTTKLWPAGTTYVAISIVYIDNVEVGPVLAPFKMGGDKIGSSFIPKGRELVCHYTNRSATDTKKVIIYFNILYGRVRA